MAALTKNLLRLLRQKGIKNEFSLTSFWLRKLDVGHTFNNLSILTAGFVSSFTLTYKLLQSNLDYFKFFIRSFDWCYWLKKYSLNILHVFLSLQSTNIQNKSL